MYVVDVCVFAQPLVSLWSFSVSAWGHITGAKADSQSCSSPLFNSLHCGSECPARLSCSTYLLPAPLLTSHLTRRTAPLCWGNALAGSMHYSMRALRVNVNAVHVRIALLIKKHVILQTEIKAHLSYESLNTSHSLRGGGISVWYMIWGFFTL